MSARDIIREIEALPSAEQQAVLAYLEKAREARSSGGENPRMTVDDAIDHVFQNYDGLLAKLAK